MTTSGAATAADGSVPAGRPGRRALCLCGGGILGAMYQIGALTAIDDYFSCAQPAGAAFGSTRFDMYVGISAGAFVATSLCAGISPRRLARGVLGEKPERDFLPSRRTDIFRFEAAQLWEVASKLGRVALRALSGLTAGELRLAELYDELLTVLPGGLFSLRHYERFIEDFLTKQGLPTEFRHMPRELFIPANDLDSGHRTVFGGKGDDYLAQVPIAKAICASSAIPLFFEPVRIKSRDYIDGATGKADHVDIALKRGADLVLIINPIVPIRNDPHDEGMVMGGRSGHLRDRGMLTVYDQTMRMSIKARLHQGLRRWQAAYPNATLLLLEPDERDSDMFLYSPMNFDARRQIMRYGYLSAAQQLRQRQALFTDVSSRYGLLGDLNRLQTSWP